MAIANNTLLVFEDKILYRDLLLPAKTSDVTKLGHLLSNRRYRSEFLRTVFGRRLPKHKPYVRGGVASLEPTRNDVARIPNDLTFIGLHRSDSKLRASLSQSGKLSTRFRFASLDFDI